jgi:dinuclear metal center YbgI/SA1388 family protein
LLEAAVEAGADAVLVHHGYFWQGEDPRIIGMKQRRLGLLLRNEVSLLAYHLPLDAHPECGNNVQLARRLGWRIDGCIESSASLVWHGVVAQPTLPSALTEQLRQCLGREVTYVGDGQREIRRIGWCTGAGQKYLPLAAEFGLDAFITGEISEPTVHVARELGVHFYAAGHHATERYGVQALAQHLQERFGVSAQFIDVDSPA